MVVQEVYQQFFVDSLPEDALKTDIGKGIDESCHISRF